MLYIDTNATPSYTRLHRYVSDTSTILVLLVRTSCLILHRRHKKRDYSTLCICIRTNLVSVGCWDDVRTDSVSVVLLGLEVLSQGGQEASRWPLSRHFVSSRTWVVQYQFRLHARRRLWEWFSIPCTQHTCSACCLSVRHRWHHGHSCRYFSLNYIIHSLITIFRNMLVNQFHTAQDNC